MHLFYTPDIHPADKEYSLNEEESKHCIRVLRLQEGDTVVLVDGNGGWYDASIIDAHPKRARLSITLYTHGRGRLSYHLHVAIAPPKNIERMEWFLEKSTELGISEITPLLTERSERKEIRVDRLQKIITSAVKQSLTSYHPKLNDLQTYKQFVQQQHEGIKTIAHCLEGEKHYLSNILLPQQKVIVLIGPEGDFSLSETQLANQFGYQSVSLGESRLRTETAAVQVCCEVAILNRE